MLRYVWRDLTRNTRRTMASLVGVVLGVGLFSGVLFFIDGSGASMTKRALAPLALDMQRVMTSPLGEGLRLSQRLDSQGPLRAGDRVGITLTVKNRGAAPANEVVINDKLPGELNYVPGSATRDGAPIPDAAGQSPFAHGPARIGHNIGTVAPNGAVELGYVVRATRPVANGSQIALRGTVSSREVIVPQLANRPDLVPLNALRARIGTVPGVVAADELAFADLPGGALRANGRRVDRSVKIFGFGRDYADHYSSVRVSGGRFAPGSALLSAEAGKELGVKPGGTVELLLPGAKRPVRLPVSGIVDLSRSRQLFNSRQGLKLEDFLYVPNSIVVSPEMFRDLIVSAFRNATAARGSALAVKSPPTLEVDVLVDRSRLNSDPAAALVQTTNIASEVKRVAPGQDFVLDNVSNTLQVAKGDAGVAKQMFLFLGLPGLLLAGFLAAYAGSILAVTQRREQANLRLRGAHRGHLLRALAYRTLAIAGVGALLGTALGFASVMATLGPSQLLAAAPGSLVASAALAAAGGLLATGLALYLPGHRALGREVTGERREMALQRPSVWRRWRLDYAALGLTVAGVILALRTGAFDAAAGAVSAGESVSLSSRWLLLPLGIWVFGVLLSLRLFDGVGRRLPVAAPPRFGPLVSGTLSRSLGRRTAPLLIGITGVGLVIGFGLGLAVFASTYDAAKQADAAFTVGSNLRVTPSPNSERPHPAAFASRLRVAGVQEVTPVVAGRENSFLRSSANSDVKHLAAIDPRSFRTTAALSDQFFVDATTDEAMDALATQPTGILIDPASADVLKLEVGDTAELLMARGSKRQRNREMTVVGLFNRLPGFPEGLQVVMNLDYYRSQTGLTNADFFLARTADPGKAGLVAAATAIDAGPGAKDPLNVDSTATTFNKEQSSLTALNVRGLVDLDSTYTLVISAAVVGMFVFGLLLQRRREYVTMRAQGLPAATVQVLILGEALFVAIGGVLAGLVVGTGMGLLLVQVLKPLFILAPIPVTPVGDAALLAGLVLAATAASGFMAMTILRRLSPAEVLREH